jgi:hypothetical protein
MTVSNLGKDPIAEIVGMGAGEKIRVGDDNDPFTGSGRTAFSATTARQLGAAYSIDLFSADKHFRSQANHHCVEGASR